ncbi:MAG: hypothetical protein ACKVTZ_18860 [Bacteroidia bacterium]
MIKPPPKLEGIHDVVSQAEGVWNNEWVQLGIDVFYIALFIKGFANWNRSGYDKVSLIATSVAKLASLATSYDIGIERK